MKHVWEEHKDCRELSCPICDGGLALCTVCGLTEGCLTTDCPGVESYREYGDAVYNGKIDYHEGKGWVKKPSPSSPGSFGKRMYPHRIALTPMAEGFLQDVIEDMKSWGMRLSVSEVINDAVTHFLSSGIPEGYFAEAKEKAGKR